MKNILILFCLLFSVALSAQKVINSNPFTNASGDLRGKYPSPKVGLGVIGNNNITTGLRDSIQRFRKDTTIQVVNATLNMGSQANLYGKFNRVYVFANSYGGTSSTIVLPAGADTLKNTEFIIRHLGADTTSYTCQVFSFDGFASAYSALGYVTDVSITLKSRRVLFTKPFKVGTDWYYEQSILNYSYSAIAAEQLGITAITGDITAVGNGAVTSLINNLAVTTGKINNLAVTTGKLANMAVTNAKIANDAINSANVIDGSLVKNDIASYTLDSTRVKLRSLSLINIDPTGATNNQVVTYDAATNKLVYKTTLAPSGTARTIPFHSSTGNYLYNLNFKLDTTPATTTIYKLSVNNPTGISGEGDPASGLNVRVGNGTSAESIFNVGNQSSTMSTVGTYGAFQIYRSRNTFTSKTNLLNGDKVGHYAFRGQVGGSSQPLGDVTLNYTGDGTTVRAELLGRTSTAAATSTAGWKLDDQSRFWLGSGASSYYFPLATPGTGDNYMVWKNNVPQFTELKRDTLIYLNNADYNLGTALTSPQVAARHGKIVINSYLSAAASSDNQLTMPVPGANYENCEIQYYAYDESGDTDDATITFGTNLGVLGNGSYTSSYDLVAGQMVTIRCMKDAKDNNNYKWFFW